jgi:hypothetical protein
MIGAMLPRFSGHVGDVAAAALKAADLENAPGLMSPARWISLAGWRRAGVLNRSMGEFSHLELRSRRSGTCQLLSEMQDPEAEESLRLYLG